MNPIGEVKKLLEDRASSFESKLDRIIELLEVQASAADAAIALTDDSREVPAG